jgi:hypothetical protein
LPLGVERDKDFRLHVRPPSYQAKASNGVSGCQHRAQEMHSGNRGRSFRNFVRQQWACIVPRSDYYLPGTETR